MQEGEIKRLLTREEFPRSAEYDPTWVTTNQMGPNALWLTEWLCQGMQFEPGMRVLDMGCGKALSSIFLAKEFGVQVWATDLWVKADENMERIRQAGLSHQVFPIHAEARDLPYANEFFDAIVCVDSYIYYGTDDLYLNYFRRFVKPGHQIGIAMPGLMRDFNGPLPEHLKPFWAEDCWSWHTVAWWRHLWERQGIVNVETCDSMPEGWRVYLQWKKALDALGENRWPHDIEVLEKDEGRYIGFIRMVARTK